MPSEQDKEKARADLGRIVFVMSVGISVYVLLTVPFISWKTGYDLSEPSTWLPGLLPAAWDWQIEFQNKF